MIRLYREDHPWNYFVAVAVVIVVLPELFKLSIWTGLFACGALIFSFLNKTLIKKPVTMSVGITAGSLVGYAGSTTWPEIMGYAKGGESLNALILIIVYLLVFLEGRRMSSGKHPKLRYGDY